MKLAYVHILLLTFCISACVKDKPNPDIRLLPSSSNHGILVLNEGAYGNNNAEISFIDLENNEISNSVFKSVNSKSLGDVAQNIALINGHYYITINNSNKIAILDTSNYQLLQTIDNVPFPRYITQVASDKAYVSSLYNPKVFVLDLINNSIVDTIQIDFPNSENMLVKNEDVWICNWDTACNYVYKVNINTNDLEQKINLNAFAPHDILDDKNGMIWILSGNKYKNKNSFLTCLNPQTNSIIKSMAFTSNEDPIRLTMNASKDTMYFINVNYNGSSKNGLYRMTIYDHEIPDAPFIQAPTNTYFWTVGIDSNTSTIYLSDPKGFTQNSTIYSYSNDGTFLKSYQTGIGSNQFLFK